MGATGCAAALVVAFALVSALVPAAAADLRRGKRSGALQTAGARADFGGGLDYAPVITAFFDGEDNFADSAGQPSTHPPVRAARLAPHRPAGQTTPPPTSQAR